LSEQPTGYAAEAARLRAENETLRADCELLRIEATRLGSLTQKLQAQLAIADASATSCAATRPPSSLKPWRAVQALTRHGGTALVSEDDAYRRTLAEERERVDALHEWLRHALARLPGGTASAWWRR
jgi:hypothetical protein